MPAQEVRFWALVVVALALFTQVLFPPQVMAVESESGQRLVLCSSGIDSQPIVEPGLAKILNIDTHKKGLQGLKCADCVLASLTAIQTPVQTYVPAVYRVEHIAFCPLQRTSPVKARAPPRPYSCGPPSQI
ncbi:hypothetical protein [Asticcacaulis sp. EMRT-3]|uniref:hypothetical protein n=1 Tax=Asticcacaulis sp. EMRT-3 TaxID=3040349 RepID=UPI0024AF50DF|nr:hypothetical protein [Asticcacaulis sp. EMRT-3]MDI7774525.1 hypothetical protein [Asticcacaulis sp. EMRT-3]